MQKSKCTSVDIDNMKELAMREINEALDAIDIFLPCEDGSGEIYNRKTGDRYSIQKTGMKQSNEKKSLISIGGFNSVKKTGNPKSKIGSWTN